MALYFGLMPKRAAIIDGRDIAGYVRYSQPDLPEQRIMLLLAGRFGELSLCRIPGGEKAWAHELTASIDFAKSNTRTQQQAVELHHRCFEECQRLFQDDMFRGAVNSFAMRLHSLGELHGNDLIETCLVALRLIKPGSTAKDLVGLRGFGSVVTSVWSLPPVIRRALIVRWLKLLGLWLGIGIPFLYFTSELHEYSQRH